jgi:phage terminase large subunit
VAVVEIPYKPRNWARPFHESSKRFFALLLHRRIGKTTGVTNHHQRAALSNDWEAARLKAVLPSLTDDEIKPLLRGRLYGHVMPTYRQAELAAWRMLKHYAAPIPGATPNESKLLIKYPNGSILQLFGADNPDSFRGAAFSGASFDEFSQQPRNIYSEVVSKALADHLGYAIFSGTIKGKDHLYQTYEAAKAHPDWFTLWQDVDLSLKTEDAATVKVLEQAMADDREQIRQGLMTQDEYDQEWYLSPEAAIKGAIYGRELTAARQDGRITNVPHDPSLPVNTYWDLGMHMAIWFEQATRSGEVRLIDYYESGGQASLPECVQVLNGKPYTYGRHVAPHDIVVKELASGRSRLESAAAMGIRFEIAPKLSIEDGINALRLLFPRLWIDSTKCAAGLEALRHYRRDFNTRLNEYKDAPLHDWSSHGADAARYLAVTQQTPKAKSASSGYSLPRGEGGWMGA